MLLGVFEMVIHTAGKWICSIKGWYTPGIATGWAMGFASIWCIAALAQSVATTGADALVGIVTTAAVLACLQVLVQKSADYSVPQTMAHMRQRVLRR